ncbi:uncharacterized protein LOC136096729 [Hydra vulgaris]|uniref:uncharacterized protein LOC136096729 n=1 Tax=Hydra vulgaris TaxID=6087 RepID=UPI0032EA6245
MFNESNDIEMLKWVMMRLDDVLHLQNNVNAIRRVENNYCRNERNRLRARRGEINQLQNVSNAARRAENNLNPNIDNAVMQIKNNQRRNDRDKGRRNKINLRQNARNAARPGRMYPIARGNAIPDCNYLGEMNQICQHCGAKKFPDETHFLCCHNGKVALPPLSPFTQVLQDLTGSYVDRNANGNFLKHIRNFNAFFSFASFKANIVQPINHGPLCFKIYGQIYHNVGNLRPDQDIPPINSQLYI